MIPSIHPVGLNRQTEPNRRGWERKLIKMYIVAYRYYVTFYSYENQVQYGIEGEREMRAQTELGFE